jgi:hypothetical protein
MSQDLARDHGTVLAGVAGDLTCRGLDRTPQSSEAMRRSS